MDNEEASGSGTGDAAGTPDEPHDEEVAPPAPSPMAPVAVEELESPVADEQRAAGSELVEVVVEEVVVVVVVFPSVVVVVVVEEAVDDAPVEGAAAGARVTVSGTRGASATVGCSDPGVASGCSTARSTARHAATAEAGIAAAPQHAPRQLRTLPKMAGARDRDTLQRPDAAVDSKNAAWSVDSGQVSDEPR